MHDPALVVYVVAHPSTLLALPILWFLLCYLSSLMSGWHALSRRFTACSEPQGETLHAGAFFDSVRWDMPSRYGSSVSMTAASDALYLSVPFTSRPGCPPLCIPWNEIKVSRTDRPWLNMIALHLGSEEQILLRITEHRAAQLGLFDRFPSELGVPVAPNFDKLSDEFFESQLKKPE